MIRIVMMIFTGSLVGGIANGGQDILVSKVTLDD